MNKSTVIAKTQAFADQIKVELTKGDKLVMSEVEHVARYEIMGSILQAYVAYLNNVSKSPSVNKTETVSINNLAGVISEIINKTYNTTNDIDETKYNALVRDVRKKLRSFKSNYTVQGHSKSLEVMGGVRRFLNLVQSNTYKTNIAKLNKTHRFRTVMNAENRTNDAISKLAYKYYMSRHDENSDTNQKLYKQFLNDQNTYYNIISAPRVSIIFNFVDRQMKTATNFGNSVEFYNGNYKIKLPPARPVNRKNESKGYEYVDGAGISYFGVPLKDPKKSNAKGPNPYDQIFSQVLSGYKPGENARVFLSGPTGSGKTTALEAFIKYVGDLEWDNSTMIRYYGLSVSRGSNPHDVYIKDTTSEESSLSVFAAKYIRPTPFNPQSSRAHLYIDIKADKNPKLKKRDFKSMRVYDLAGKEDPFAIMDIAFNGLNIFSEDLWRMSSVVVQTPELRALCKATLGGKELKATGIKDKMILGFMMKTFFYYKEDVTDQSKLQTEWRNIIKGDINTTMESITSNINNINIATKDFMNSYMGDLGGISDKFKFGKNNAADDIKFIFEDEPELKVCNYVYHMIHRVLEGIYITRTLNELKVIFKPKLYTTLESFITATSNTHLFLSKDNKNAGIGMKVFAPRQKSDGARIEVDIRKKEKAERNLAIERRAAARSGRSMPNAIVNTVTDPNKRNRARKMIEKMIIGTQYDEKYKESTLKPDVTFINKSASYQTTFFSGLANATQFKNILIGLVNAGLDNKTNVAKIQQQRPGLDYFKSIPTVGK
jgi:hypothetical protein